MLKFIHYGQSNVGMRKPGRGRTTSCLPSITNTNVYSNVSYRESLGIAEDRRSGGL